MMDELELELSYDEGANDAVEYGEEVDYGASDEEEAARPAASPAGDEKPEAAHRGEGNGKVSRREARSARFG